MPPASQKVLQVIKGDSRVTLQDLGRVAAASLGVQTSGVADEYGFLAANQLLGNELDCPALEITLGAVTLEIIADSTIAFTGAQADIFLNDSPVKPWQKLTVKRGDKLSISMFKKGVYGYLAIAGGFIQQRFNSGHWLGSCIANDNTNLAHYYANSKSNHNHNPEPESKPEPEPEPSKLKHQHQNHFYADKNFTARFIPNENWHSLSITQQNALSQCAFKINSNSNKMGYRLDADNDIASGYHSIEKHSGTLSKPVCYGQIQLPSAQQWIVLMKDCQTMGGYPTIGCVMKTDLFRLAQLSAGQQVNFVPISVEQAQNQLLAFYQKFGHHLS